MSGIKTSQYIIQRERAEKLRRLKGLAARRAEAVALHDGLHGLLAGMSDGLRAAFASETARAVRWTAAQAPDGRTVSLNSDRLLLARLYAEWEAFTEEGRQAFAHLRFALAEKADALGQRLTRELNEAETQLLGARELLTLWSGSEAVARWTAALAQGQALLGREHYTELTALLAALREELTAHIATAEANEDRHQQRLYLLTALRQVCAEMGFEELAQPYYAREGDRAGAILLPVDTLARGRITFTLALDGLSSDSELTDHHCHEEFSQLTAYLEEEFGIETAFHTEDGEPLPVLKARGEKDEPSGRSRERER